MASTKKDAFGADIIQLSDFAKALSHPARVAILKVLAKQNSCICGEIVEVLPLAQSTVSQHLKELLNAGIIKGTIEGTKSCYCIDPEAFEKLSLFFNEWCIDISKELSDNQCC